MKAEAMTIEPTIMPIASGSSNMNLRVPKNRKDISEREMTVGAKEPGFG